MRLSEFILGNKQAILIQWEAFAGAQLPAAANMTSTALRDHGEEILDAIVADLSQGQTAEAHAAKAKGLAQKATNAAQTAAQTHGILRAQSGFDIKQLASEYRALRASVLRLWMDSYPEAANADDIIRFNEAIDQALAESISDFDRKLEEAQNLFFGMLGHDLRTPLQAIQMTAVYLRGLNSGKEVSEAASRLINSGSRMKRLLTDLVEYNRTRLGFGIAISPARVNLTDVFSDEIDELRKAHPGGRIEFSSSGQMEGYWDAAALQRVLGNLVENSLKYGEPGHPVRVVVRGEAETIAFEVRNRGSAIEPRAMAMLFEPLKRGPRPQGDHEGSVGLGLYIAKKITEAHAGDITGTSSNGEVVFTVSIPRDATQRAGRDRL
jgi:signal transduction histidine kinase